MPTFFKTISNNLFRAYKDIELNDLRTIATLGVGGFGRVELVQNCKNSNMTFALKCLKKQHVVSTRQEEHVLNEKAILMSIKHPFICRLFKTFRDNKYVYLLMEALLGGEVWTIMHRWKCYNDYTARFITGCVLEALQYLHTRGIIYRDLKPENLLLDQTGYVKLVDFGFAKRLLNGTKTWTFCGTPEYVAPEIILNKGHDRAVDYWAVGILIHELLTGRPPFMAKDPMKVYNLILKGINSIHFSKRVCAPARGLIKRLCRESPTERIGYQKGGFEEIRNHKWYEGFSWNDLRNKIMTPPISPIVNSAHDYSNFECYEDDSEEPPDELSGWDEGF